MAGSAICQSDSTYSLSINLIPGANSLVAHVFNITDDEGPMSSAVNVVYDVPQPPPTTTPSGSTSPPSASAPLNPFLLKTAFVYKGYKVGEKVQWPVEVSGGTAPYAISIDWGDGTSDLLSRPQAGQFTLSHVYSSPPGNDKNSYTIKVKGSDAAGSSSFIQFFVIVVPNTIGQTTGSIFSKPTPKLGGLNWLWLAWPAYTVAVLMAVSYLLGEREELLILRKKGQLKRG